MVVDTTFTRAKSSSCFLRRAWVMTLLLGTKGSIHLSAIETHVSCCFRVSWIAMQPPFWFFFVFLIQIWCYAFLSSQLSLQNNKCAVSANSGSAQSLRTLFGNGLSFFLEKKTWIKNRIGNNENRCSGGKSKRMFVHSIVCYVGFILMPSHLDLLQEIAIFGI